jgi:hypothetical protein
MKKNNFSFIVALIILATASCSSSGSFGQKTEMVSSKNCNMFSFNTPDKYNCPMEYDHWISDNCNSFMINPRCPLDYNTKRLQQEKRSFLSRSFSDQQFWKTKYKKIPGVSR